MYTITTDGVSGPQVEALPETARPAFDEACRALEVAPKTCGEPYMASLPYGPMRTMTFGAAGMMTYMVLDDDRRVDLLAVFWPK